MPWWLFFDLQTQPNFIMAFIETVGQKSKTQDSKTLQLKIRESEMQRNTRKRDFKTHPKCLRDFEVGTKISETMNFPGTIHHPLWSECRCSANPGGYLTKFDTGRLFPEVQPLTLLYHLAEKVLLLYTFYWKRYPFHIPSLGSLVLIFMWYLIIKLIQP